MARFLGYLAKRIVNYIVMIFVATSLTYFLACAFMSPRSNYESRTPRPSQESIEASLDKANLNDKTPVTERYQRWLSNIVTDWNWGLSPAGDSVNNEISSRIGASVKLMLLSTILSIVIGVSLGVYTAQRQYQWQDRFWSGLASVFLVIPTVVLAILIVFFAIEINQQTGQRIFYVTGLSSYDGPNFFIGPSSAPWATTLTSARTSWTRCTLTTCARRAPRASPRSRPSVSTLCAPASFLPR